MEGIGAIHIFLYIVLNYLGYSLVIIFQLLFISTFPAIYHLLQLFLSNICIYLLFKIRLANNYVNPNSSTSKGNIESSNTDNAKIIGENDPIIQFNLMPNIGCDFCKITKLPLRSHHCEICNKCVKCFDHHCWILAGCIGENNKLFFIIFLLLQNCSIDCSLFAIMILLKEQKNEDIKYFLTFYFSLICLFSVIFLFTFIYHFYLFITNQTNYELFNEEQCPYILVYSFEKNKYLQQRGVDIGNNIRYKPFDMGFKNNFFLYFNLLNNKDNKNGINWENIYYENLKNTRHKTDCCDKINKIVKNINN